MTSLPPFTLENSMGPLETIIWRKKSKDFPIQVSEFVKPMYKIMQNITDLMADSPFDSSEIPTA